MADTSSNSFSQSQSQSTSGSPQLTALAEQFMQDQYTWGQQQFADNSQLTDQVVGDMLNLYGSLSGIGNQMMGLYSSYFVPEYNQLVTDANNYASPARIQQAMGAAESGVAQDFNSQRNAALAELQSFGIDPSSGRYAELDSAERMQQAAAQAGAGFQAEQATEATGRALRSEALQLGSVMPSQATAAYNASGQAATAAENAKLANAQEGVNMMGNPTQWAGIAAQQRQATSGSVSGKNGNSSPSQKTQGNGQNPSSIQSTGPGPGYNPLGGGPSAVNGSGQTNQPNAGLRSGGGGGSQDASAAIRSGNGGPANGINPNDPSSWTDSGAIPAAPYEDPSQTLDPWSAQVADSSNDWNAGSPQMAPNPDEASFPNEMTADPSAQYGMNPNPWPSSPDGNDTFSPGDTLNTSSDTSSSNDSSYNDNSGGEDSFDSSDNSDYSGGDDGGGGDDFADGGVIPYHMSPSQGRVTDDVPGRVNQTGEPIRVNAGEMIIDRPTVQWKGLEYFHNLMKKSKAAREQHDRDHKPQMRPALPAHNLTKKSRHGG